MTDVLGYTEVETLELAHQMLYLVEFRDLLA
jgi:hypothetical protein